MKLGLFDSGVGGLTVLYQFLKHGLKFEYLYLADTARAPFGTKTVEEIKGIALECANFLFEKGADVVISACNTAQAALKASGINLGENFFGILDFELPNGFKKIGVLATEATVRSGVYLEKCTPRVLKCSNNLVKPWLQQSNHVLKMMRSGTS